MIASRPQTEILLDLTDDIRDANAFISPAKGTDLSKLIQQEALKRFQNLVKKIIGNIQNDENQAKEKTWDSTVLRRRHDTITINGQRGSGKTTFIVNVMHALEKNAEFCDGMGIKRGDLVSLGLVDPTLIETKEHVIVTLVTIIKKKVDEAYLRSDGANAEKNHENWTLALEDLAEGMSLLDGIGGKDAFGEDWQDSHYVMHRGLERAASGTHFEKKFHKFVSESLHFLNARAFILAFDDIDTSFVRGWEVLEIIRKYLTTSKLITILSGDMGLYSLLVRGNQWKNLSEYLLKSEQWVFEKGGQRKERQEEVDVPMFSRMPEIAKTVDQLEAQYLLKVAKPENRIDLVSLQYYARKGSGYNLKVRDTQDNGYRSILDTFADIAKHSMGFRATGDQELFQTILLRQPTRMVMQILQGVQSQPDTDEQDAWSMEMRRSIQSALHSALYSRGFDPDTLRDTDPANLLMVFIDWLTETRNWELAYRLRPEHRDDTLNLALIAIGSAMLTAFRQKPGAMLEYMLKIARPQLYLTRNLTKKSDYKNYIAFTGLTTTESVLQSTRKMIAWERTFGAMTQHNQQTQTTRQQQALVNRRLDGGVAVVLARSLSNVKDGSKYHVNIFTLYGLTYNKPEPKKGLLHFRWEDGEQIKEALSNLRGGGRSEIIEYFSKILTARDEGKIKNKKIHYSHLAFNSISSLVRNLHGAGRLLVNMPLTLVLDNTNSTHGCYSIYPLLAFVSTLLSVADDVDLPDFENSIETLLVQAAAERTYPAPNEGKVLQGSDIDDKVDEDDGSEDAEDDDDTKDDWSVADYSQIKTLVSAITKWTSQSRNYDLTLSPLTLARAMTRYLYTSQNISDELRALTTRYLGTFMHRQIIAFLNAVLLESLLAVGKQEGVNLKNPVTSADPFIKNLKAAGYSMDIDPTLPEREPEPHLALFHVLASCPLWGFFLAPHDKDNHDKHNKIFNWQLNTWKQCLPADNNPKSLVSAGFSPARRDDQVEPDIEFDNLYDPLNSVPIQGAGRSSALKFDQGSRGQSGKGEKNSGTDGRDAAT